MIDQHLGRRSISDFQRGVLALRKRDILETRLRAARAGMGTGPAAPEEASLFVTDDDSGTAQREASADHRPDPVLVAADLQAIKSREALAKAARISSTQVRMIETIQSQAAPEIVEAVKAGDITLSTAAVIASLPAEEQVQAAHGGTKELRQTAKRVREAKRKPKQEAPAAGEEAAAAPAEDNVESLRARVRELEAENAALRARLAEFQAN